MLLWDHDVKNSIRSEVVASDSVYTDILVLPSESCLDVIEMLNKGSITTETRIVAVERDYYTAKLIEEKFNELKLTNFTIINSELHLVSLEGKFDFVFIDTCGQLTASIVNWLSTQVQEKRFTKDCKITLAFSNFARGGFEFVQNWEKYLVKTKYRKAKVNPTLLEINSAVQIKQHRLMATMLRDILGEVTNSWIYKNTGHHPPMHVFQFATRQQNAGLINIIKFLKLYTKEEPKILTPGLKAAATRLDLRELRSQGRKTKETRTQLQLLWEKIAQLEKLISISPVIIKPKYHKLTILEDIGLKRVKCLCECGNIKETYKKQVIDGAVKSCGLKCKHGGYKANVVS